MRYAVVSEYAGTFLHTRVVVSSGNTTITRAFFNCVPNWMSKQEADKLKEYNDRISDGVVRVRVLSEEEFKTFVCELDKEQTQ